ncbi:MAG: hypothetical protein M3237_16300 [Actinomycetota bacterium]|nr:hypothetical protein [Actinomycetota bacterium]
MQQWSVPVWVVAGVLAAAVLAAVTFAVLFALALRRVRAQTAEELALARAEASALRTQVEEIERRLSSRANDDEHEYVITRLGDEVSVEPSEPTPMVPGPLFADLVLRETVVQAASLASGLRRALAPEMRHRIRFEMKREVKRARKQRRADLRQARREWEARQRAEVRLDEPAAGEDSAEDSAA